MVVERDEVDEPLPGEQAGDAALAAVIGEMIALVFERFPDPAGAEHREAMTMLLDLHRRLRARERVRRLH
jgi:hypothetical protein